MAQSALRMTIDPGARRRVERHLRWMLRLVRRFRSQHGLVERRRGQHAVLKAAMLEHRAWISQAYAWFAYKPKQEPWEAARERATLLFGGVGVVFSAVSLYKAASS